MPQESTPGTERVPHRRGSALLMVLILTIALSALAASAIMLTAGSSLVTRYRGRERDLRYAAQAALQLGISDVSTNPFALPESGYVQLASNAQLTAADGAPVPNVVYDLYGGVTGAATRQQGRFATLVAIAKDTAAKRTFIRWTQLNQQVFARYAYFSTNEAGICFGSDDRINGPLFTDDVLQVCGSPQKADFMDSVGTAQHAAVSGGNVIPPGGGPLSPAGMAQDTFYDGIKTNQKVVNMPNTSTLAKLFSIAAAGGTEFFGPNTATDSTSSLQSRIEFVAYDANGDGDSTDANEGYLRYYRTDPTTRSMGRPAGTSLAVRDSLAVGYLRAGITRVYDGNTCGDWHLAPDDNGTLEWEFVPYNAHFHQWMRTIDSVALKAQRAQAGGQPTDSLRIKAELQRFVGDVSSHTFSDASNNPWIWFLDTLPVANASFPPRCYPGGDPHLVAVERDSLYPFPGAPAPPARTGTFWTTGGLHLTYNQRGGVDTTFTDSLHSAMGHWSTSPFAGSIPATIKANHPRDYTYLYPINAVVNPNFRGVVAVHGSVAVSGNMDGHITLYTNGTVGIVDNLRLTNPSDTTCTHLMGIVAGANILAMDNGINVPQGDTAVRRQMRNGSSDLYVQSTVMALHSWGAEGLCQGGVACDPDRTNVPMPWYVPLEQSCSGQNYARGCLWVQGSIIQSVRQTVNSGNGTTTGFGYAKRYTYDQCVIQNPPPYFPITGIYAIEAYYEADPAHFNVAALFAALRPGG